YHAGRVRARDGDFRDSLLPPCPAHPGRLDGSIRPPQSYAGGRAARRHAAHVHRLCHDRIYPLDILERHSAELRVLGTDFDAVHYAPSCVLPHHLHPSPLQVSGLPLADDLRGGNRPVYDWVSATFDCRVDLRVRNPDMDHTNPRVDRGQESEVARDRKSTEPHRSFLKVVPPRNSRTGEVTEVKPETTLQRAQPSSRVSDDPARVGGGDLPWARSSDHSRRPRI